jgi:mono/diheme cytochrome c family protein/uncharacterized membrane protein
MRRGSLIIPIVSGVFACFTAPSAAADDESARDLGGEARAVFASKCAMCHGPDLVNPRGHFGYVLDLRRIADNPQMVIPGQPSESELLVLVERNEMPPGDSPRGPLTSEQKLVIREWITAGAPEPAPAGTDQPQELMNESAAPATGVYRLIGWLGKFHLLMLHFPIALFLAAAMAEAYSVLKGSPRFSDSVRFCLWLAALFAIPTAVFGWLFAAAGNGVGSPQILMVHRWLGTTAAVWLVLTAVIAEMVALQKMRGRGLRAVMAVGVALIVGAAHFGGLLAQGADFFDY